MDDAVVTKVIRFVLLDDAVDYRRNTLGMNDAAIRLRKQTPADYQKAKAQKEIKQLKREIRNQIGQF